jgi:O-antigen ligase
MENLKSIKTLYISFYFIAIGIFVSVSVPSLHHILAIIPLCIFTFKFVQEGERFPKSAWVLIVFTLWSYLTNFINFESLDRPFSTFGKEKYQLFGIMLIPGLYYMKEYMTSYRWKKIINVFFFTIFLSTIYGIIAAKFRFDLLTWSEVPLSHSKRSEGLTETMRYGYGLGYVVTMMLACIPFLKKGMHIFNKKYFYATLIMAFIGLMAAATRGAFLGIFVSIPFMLYFINKKASLISFLVAGFTIVGILGFLFSGGSSSIRLFSKLGNNSNMKRLSQYETGYRTFLEKPLFGHGTGTFPKMCEAQKKKI